MTKLLTTTILALAITAVLAADAQAFGRRGRSSGGGCGAGGCGAGASAGYATYPQMGGTYYYPASFGGAVLTAQRPAATFTVPGARLATGARLEAPPTQHGPGVFDDLKGEIAALKKEIADLRRVINRLKD